MHNNDLKLNMDKTDVLLLSPNALFSKQSDICCNIDGVQVKPSSTVSNLGVIFNKSPSLPTSVPLLKLHFFHLHNIAQLRMTHTLF